MRVAQHLVLHQAQVLLDLRRGVQARARVVEVHLAVVVEPRVLGRPQRAQQLRAADHRRGRDEGLDVDDGHAPASAAGISHAPCAQTS